MVKINFSTSLIDILKMAISNKDIDQIVYKENDLAIFNRSEGRFCYTRTIEWYMDDNYTAQQREKYKNFILKLNDFNERSRIIENISKLNCVKKINNEGGKYLW